MSALHHSSRAFQDRHFDDGNPTEGGGKACRGSLVRSDRTGTELAVRKIIRTRAERSEFLPSHLFADPAWNMLLDLILTDILSQRISVTSLCIASNVPAATALRWITKGSLNARPTLMVIEGLFMSLSAEGLAAMDDFFSSAVARSIH